MQKVINTDTVRSVLSKQGITQKGLAESVGVSPQAVTNWLHGIDFPRPAMLLKLATILKLTFDQLVQSEDAGRPIIAFRKKGNAKTTTLHITKAVEIGMLLKPLVQYLPELRALRPLLTSPSKDYDKLQVAVSQTRKHLGLGEQAVLAYEHLISEFKNCGAVLVPVLWGAKQRHENALHIRLPKEDVTFIFLNLDTCLEDFKFWMAHELAHVYTPNLTGTNEGEDYADAFAGALLFPMACANAAYHETIGNPKMVDVLQRHAQKHAISLNTVYQQVIRFAEAKGFSRVPLKEKDIHVARNICRGPYISEALFDPMPPTPDRYIAIFKHAFQSDFFYALRRMIHEQHTGPSYIQQILDAPIYDTKGLYEELHH